MTSTLRAFQFIRRQIANVSSDVNNQYRSMATNYREELRGTEQSYIMDTTGYLNTLNRRLSYLLDTVDTYIMSQDDSPSRRSSPSRSSLVFSLLELAVDPSVNRVDVLNSTERVQEVLNGDLSEEDLVGDVFATTLYEIVKELV